MRSDYKISRKVARDDGTIGLLARFYEGDYENVAVISRFVSASAEIAVSGDAPKTEIQYVRRGIVATEELEFPMGTSDADIRTFLSGKIKDHSSHEPITEQKQ